MYNKGAGRYIPISKIVLIRNKERARHKLLPELRTLENPDEEFDIEQHLTTVTEMDYAMNPNAYRDVCWDLKVLLRLPLCILILKVFNLGKRCCRRIDSAPLSTQCHITARGPGEATAKILPETDQRRLHER